MFAPPLALVVSIVGLVRDKNKAWAIAGTALSGCLCALWAIMLAVMLTMFD